MRFRCLVVAIALFWPLVARADEPAPTTQQQIAQIKAKQQAESLNEVASHPVIEAKAIAELVQIKLRDADLEISTPLGSTDESVVKIPGLPGLSKINVTTFAGPGGPDPAVMVRFANMDFTPDDVIYVLTEVSQTPGQLMLSQSFARLDDQTHNITLIQNTRELAEGETRVSMYVQITAEPPVDLRLGADSIVDLRRKHPAEVAKYVDPIFRTLRQDGLLSRVDPRLAWQVFSDTFAPDEKLKSEVNALLLKLGAEGFADRESASQSLEQLGQSAALALMHADRSALNEEQLGRLDAFLAKFKVVPDADAARMKSDRDFLLDCLFLDDQALRQRALEQLRKVTNQPIDFDVNASEEQRLTAITRLRDALGKSPATQANTKS